MTLDAYIGNINSVVKVFNFILDALSEFEGKYNKKFNFTKLANYLKIPKSEIDKIVSLILNFQEKFETVFKDYRLKEKLINNQIYIVSEKKASSSESNQVKNLNNKEIYLKKSEAKLLSDVVYLFKFVKRGKGYINTSIRYSWSSNMVCWIT